MPENLVPLAFPLGGVDVTNEEQQQRPNSSARGVNVRGRDALESRYRGGSRPGLTRYIDAQVNGDALIQHLNTIVTVNELALPANQWNADDEKFYADDPSTPSENGWTYIGSYDAPITDDFIPDPSDNLPTFRGKDKKPEKKIGDCWPPGPREGMNIKMRPIITWGAPAAIEFPTPLSATQLSPKATHPKTREPVPGTFAFFPPKGTVLAVGANRPLRTIFTPTNLAKWFPAKAETQITVTPFAGGHTTYGGYSYPNTLNVLFEWPYGASETYSWRTTATFDGAGTWTVDGLPHDLCDLSYGNTNGKLTILAASTGLDPLVNPAVLGAGVPTRIRLLDPANISVALSLRCFFVRDFADESPYYEREHEFATIPPPIPISAEFFPPFYSGDAFVVETGTSGDRLFGNLRVVITGP